MCMFRELRTRKCVITSNYYIKHGEVESAVITFMFPYRLKQYAYIGMNGIYLHIKDVFAETAVIN